MHKILYINCSCTGSTGKIINDIADHIAGQGFENVLLAPCAPGSNPNIRYYRTSLPYEQGLYSRLNRLYGFQYGFAPLSTARIKHIIRKEKPDIIHIHCINSFMVNVYSLLRFIKKHRIPTVITNHAEFFYTGNCPLAYDCERWMTGCGNCPQGATATGGKLRDTSAQGWKKMQAAFRGLENTVMTSVSPWVHSRAKLSPIVSNLPLKTVLNGVNTKVFQCQDAVALRKKYGIPENMTVIFHPTAHFSMGKNDRKGGRHIISLANRFEDQNVLFIVAGAYAPNLHIPKNMQLLGMVHNQQMLADYYALADITVVAGKQETFNMPVAESLCCGTPVAGFYAGGPESIAMDSYSRFSTQGDVDSLYANVQALLAQKFDKAVISESAKQRYSAQDMANGYLAIYHELLKRS